MPNSVASRAGTGIVAIVNVETKAIDAIYNSPTKNKKISIGGNINSPITGKWK